MLEEQMQALRELPARVADVELQIVQLRHEMQEAFSATRSEFGGKVDGLHGRMDVFVTNFGPRYMGSGTGWWLKFVAGIRRRGTS